MGVHDRSVGAGDPAASAAHDEQRAADEDERERREESLHAASV